MRPELCYDNSYLSQLWGHWGANYSYVTKLKQVFTNYIKQDDDNPETMKEYRGVVFLEETLKKDIEYILPIHKKKEPLFVIRMKNRN